MFWANHMQQVGVPPARKGATTRSRQRMLFMFVCAAALISLAALVLFPPAGSASSLVVVLAAALALAAALSLSLERWIRGRIVDLRHNDLAESFRYGLIPREPELPEGAVRQDVRIRSTDSGPAPQHRLFGQCDCAECLSGVRPAMIDLRRDEVPPSGWSPDNGRQTSLF